MCTLGAIGFRVNKVVCFFMWELSVNLGDVLISPRLFSVWFIFLETKEVRLRCPGE
jgi:hypothetical protein